MSQEGELSTRDRLLAAAHAEFAEHGYYGTGTNRIAHRAGFAPQTFYRHFADKSQIFQAVYRAWIERTWARMGAVEAADPEDRARALAEIVLDQYRGGRGIRGTLRALLHSDSSFAALYTELGQTQLALARRRRADQLRPTLSDPEIVAYFYLVERLADAIVFGELEQMGLESGPVHHALVRVLENYLRGVPLSGGRNTEASP